MGEHQPIGKMLVAKGKLTPQQLEIGLRGRSSIRRRLGEVIVALGFVTEEDITDCLAEQYGLTIVDPASMAPEQSALDLLAPETAIAHRILPLRYSQDCIECIMADPIDFPTTDMICRLAGKRALLYLAPSSVLIAAIERAYGMHRPHLLTPKVTPSLPKGQKDREALLAKIDRLQEGTKRPARHTSLHSGQSTVQKGGSVG